MFFLCSFSLDEEEQEKIDRYLRVLEDSGVAEILKEVKIINKPQGGRPEINRYDLFATILYGFAFGSETLRDLERACRYDLRYIYLMRGVQPSYSIFGNYINDYIVPNAEKIFSVLNRQFLKECGIELDDVFIDGTKIEANANRYKFVWNPITYHTRLCDNIRTLLKQNDLDRGVSEEGIISSQVIAEKLSQFSELLSKCRKEEEKKLKKQYKQLTDHLNKALEYEEKERICGPDRNSYYKTDHDATAMTMKTDYYSGLGSHMHAAYNAQAVISKGFICAYHVSQRKNDISELIPAIDQFFRIYGHYPKNLCADAGYGSLENYRYIEEKKIGNYVKHQSWNGNVSGTNPDRYRLNEDNTITCLNGKIGKKVKLSGRHPKSKNSVFFRITGCRNCPFRQYCKSKMKRKSGNDRIFEVNIEMARYKQKAEENLLSVKGIEIRVNRSCQVEGSFGVLKQDMNYIRFRRRSLPKVTAEYMLTFTGYNIRKLFRYFSGNLKTVYWKAPDNLQPEKPKKPSAKKLSKRAGKKKNKSVNQKAKDSYKRKYK